ncbi:MAG TPA: DUF305 domain-containing protein, partial [Ilumatobacteraceae bacterium]|nr:DUF305 domain-containing protein [Ilumatobacteraceae bacterium]
ARDDLDDAGGVTGGAGGGDGEDGEPDDTIVLPWWQNPFNITVMLVTAALLAGMVGWMIGDSANSRHADAVDVGFLQDMREHHEQAVEISFLYLSLDETNPSLRVVARSITFGQGIEIGRMIQMLRDFGESEVNEGDTSMGWMGHSMPLGEMPGMATDAELDQLGAIAGAEADGLFVQLMVRHHQGGIEMADYAADNAADDEVQAMAASIADGQREEITELERLID